MTEYDYIIVGTSAGCVLAYRLSEDPTRRVLLLEAGGEGTDPQLRVRGIEGARVIDASIMPNIISGNSNAATIAIAEKGADLLMRGERRAVTLGHSAP